MLVTKRALVPLLGGPAGRGRRRGGAGEGAPRHADHRPHAAAAGEADDLRAEGRGLDGGARRGRRHLQTCRSPCSSAARSGTHEAAARLAHELGLDAPLHPLAHAARPVGELAGALGVAAGAIGKAARDITLLAQTEVGEVREGRGGGSTWMPHKHNPVAAISALGCAQQAPGLVATLLAAMVQEHERAAGAWHSEWRPLCDLLITAGSAAAWLRDVARRPRGGHRPHAGEPRRPRPDTGAAALLVDRALEHR